MKGFDAKHFLLSHLIWLAAAAVALVGFYSWRGEHDARIRAEVAVKAADAQVGTLQQAIALRDKQTTQAVVPIVKIIHDVQTVQQATQALPSVVNAPLAEPVRSDSGGGVLVPPPDVIQLFDQLADDKVCRLQLNGTVKDLEDTRSIVLQRDNEIVSLKTKPSLWHRFTGTVKVLGIGVGIGIALGHKF